jgi:[ribosomal protein S5]-alanine N-acetyltransferase
MLEFNFSPFPVLETERLILRRIDVKDANEVFALRSNPENMKYIPRPLAKTIHDAVSHIELIDSKIINNEGINWAITLKGKPKFIGIIGHFSINKENFRSEIGYMLLPEFHRQGIIPEAIDKIIDYGFDVLSLHSIEAVIDPDNYGSERVLQKSGFVKEAHILENGYYDGRFLDTVIYSLLKKNRK